MTFSDFVGFVRVVAYLAAYGLLQFRRLEVTYPAYAGLNALGSATLLYSLWWNFNLSAVVVRSICLVLTIAGWLRSRRVCTASAPPGSE